LNEIFSTDWTWLAWSGWKARIPAHWRPLRVENRERTGCFMLGDTNHAMVQVKWWTPPDKKFDFDRWLNKRCRSQWKMAKGAKAENEVPGSVCFDRACWLAKDRGGKRSNSPVWYGYASKGSLVLEIIVNGSTESEAQDFARNELLTSMRVSRTDEPVQWAVYNTRFESPPGYRMEEYRLNPGAILLFLSKNKSRLMVGQIYPGSIALDNRSLLDWAGTTVLKGKWHQKNTSDLNEYHIGASEGIRVKRIMSRPFPLDRFDFGKCVCLTGIVHDRELNRLLIAEHIDPVETNDVMVSEAIKRMNWS